MNLTAEDGKILILLARESISSILNNRKIQIEPKVKSRFSESAGAFVTLTVDSDLRGCIGFTDALFPLWETVEKAAAAAALEDPRFPPVAKEELKTIKIEVSVLAKPELLKGNPEEYEKQIKVGKHGLIVESGYAKGLLLPQVFTEYGVNASEALNMTCEKAGIARNSWKSPKCRVYKFSAEVFTEGKQD